VTKAFDGRFTAGPVIATAVHAQSTAVACQVAAAALVFLVDLLIRYTRAMLLLDLLVLVLLLLAGLARLCLGAVSPTRGRHRVPVRARDPSRSRARAGMGTHGGER
jgi:hypothetical protein